MSSPTLGHLPPPSTDEYPVAPSLIKLAPMKSMSNAATAFSRDYIDHAIEVDQQRERSRTAHGALRRQALRRSLELLAVMVFAPLVLAAVCAVLLMAVAKLLF